MSKGFRTWWPKTVNTKFVVKNIAPNRKRIKIFNYPIVNGGTRDLLSIPEVSEGVIRHSLLKGELLNKIRTKEATILFSNINLLQFDPTQKQFLQNAGVTEGLEITDNQIVHNDIRDLIHFIDDGPAGGFASGAYKECLPAGSAFPTQSIWWESSSKNQKIVELIITRDSEQKPITEKWNMYEEDGVTIRHSVTDTITYQDNLELSRTRTIS